MKKIIHILAFCFFISGCGTDSSVSKNSESNEISTTVLDIKNGIAYLPDENEPFTGKFEMYYSNDVGDDATMHLKYFIETEGKDMQIEGRKGINKITKWWFKTTMHQKFVEINYKDGKKNGLDTAWWENGEIKYTVNYIDGKLDKNFHANIVDPEIRTIV